jgi:vacuolar-type H+-ATPase subunit F/Vma7
MRPEAESQLASARLVVLGSAGLAEGFSLIGAETYPDADPAKVDEVLAQLVKDGSDALVLLESHLAHAGGYWFESIAQRRRAHRRHRTAAALGAAKLCAGGGRGGAGGARPGSLEIGRAGYWVRTPGRDS